MVFRCTGSPWECRNPHARDECHAWHHVQRSGFGGRLGVAGWLLETYIALTDRDAKAQIERNAEGIKKQITDDLAAYESQATEAEDRSEVNRIKAALNRYYQTWDALQPLSREGKTAEVVALAPQAFTPAFNELQKLLKARAQWNKQHGDRAAAAAGIAAPVRNS